jgi:hypothetical protein
MVWLKLQGESKAIKKAAHTVQLHENNKFLDLFDHQDIFSQLLMWMGVKSTLALVGTCRKFNQKQDEFWQAKLKSYRYGACSNQKAEVKKMFQLSLLADNLEKDSESSSNEVSSGRIRDDFTGDSYHFFLKFIFEDKEAYSYSRPVCALDRESYPESFTYLPFRGETPRIKKWESLLRHEECERNDDSVENFPADPLMGVQIVITACKWINLDPTPRDLKVVTVSNYEQGHQLLSEHPIRDKHRRAFRQNSIPCKDLRIYWSALGNNSDSNYLEIGFVTSSTSITGVCFHHGNLENIDL